MDSPQATTTSLSFSQGFAQVEALRESLLALLAADAREICIDAGEVEQVDTSTMQLLAAFVRDAEALGKRVVWSQPSRRFAEVARLTGATAALRLGEAKA